MPVTLNGGFPMPSWFDLYSLDTNGRVDEPGIERAKALVEGLINAEEKAGIPSNRILLGGFSQGGALALYSGLTYPKPLAGIIALSCWIPLHDKLNISECNKKTPTIQCHGDADPIVIFNFLKLLYMIILHYICFTGRFEMGTNDIGIFEKTFDQLQF